MPGDINNQDNITAADAQWLLNHLVQNTSYTNGTEQGFTLEQFKEQCKVVNPSGTVFSCADASYIYSYVKEQGTANNYPITQPEPDPEPEPEPEPDPEPEPEPEPEPGNLNKQWTKMLDTSTPDISYSLATDSNNNIYITGCTKGDLDGNTNAGNYDAFLTKYNSNGDKQWTEMLGTNSEERSNSVATDSNDNIYIAGFSKGNLDGNTYGGSADIFLTKYNSNGDKQWTETLGTNSDERATSVAIDSNDNIYITGYTDGDLDGNTHAGSYDAFLIKYNSNGDKQWTQLLGSSDSNDRGYFVAIDSNNNIYITGYTEGDLDGNTNAGSKDAFLTKYNSNGDKQWTEMLGTNSEEISYSVATDPNNNIYITGYTKGDLDGNTNAGSWGGDIILIKYNSNGDKQWTEMLGTNSDEAGYSVATDSNNNIYITGRTNGDLDGNTSAGYDTFLTKYNSNGDKQWTEMFGSSTSEYGQVLAIDSNNNIYITGYTYGDLDGNTNAGSADIFLTKYGP